MKRILALILTAVLLTAGGCGKIYETPVLLPFPDFTLEARAEDMAVSGSSLFWCAEGLVYRLDLTAEEKAASEDWSDMDGTVFFDGFPVSVMSSEGDRLALCSSGGELLVGIPGAEGMEKTQNAVLPLPSGGEIAGLALAEDTAVFSWRDAESGSDRVGFFNLSNGDFLEDTPAGEGRILLCGGDAEHVYICRPDSMNGLSLLFGFDVKSMKRDAIFPAEDLAGLAAIGWNAEDGCLYALDGTIGGSNLYRFGASDGESGEKRVPSDTIRNAPRKLLFANGSAVVLHGGAGEITLCRDFFGSEEEEEITVTVLVPDDMVCNLDKLSSPLYEEYGIRLVMKKMKTEAIDTKLLARDGDYDLWIGANYTLNLNYPIWEPLEDYPLIKNVTELLFDDIVRICSSGGHLFGLPYSMQLANCTLPWNGELAEKLGIEKPEAGWTLDDFLTLARSLREQGYYICGNAWPVTLHDYMWRYFDPFGTGELNDDGTSLRKLLIWGKTLEDEGLLYPDSTFGPKDLVLLSGPIGANIVYSTSETVPDPTIDGREIYSDSASFLMMNPLSPHKEEASAVLAAMIDPKYGLYTLPTSLLYYYKDFGLYRWDSPNPEDAAFLEAAANEADRAEREQLIRDRGARMIEAEKQAGTYTDIWNMDAKTRDNYELYLHILSNYKLGRSYTKDWLMFAQDECRRYLDSEQDLDYTVKRILERAKMALEG